MTLRKPPRGFTLTELAIVLVIVALFMSSLLIPLNTQRDIEQRKAAQQTLETIREALTGFAIQNGRLPCPAQATLATGAANAGFEAVVAVGGGCACSSAAAVNGSAENTAIACNGNTVNGVLPWATLGLPELDPWGRRYTYQVSNRFARNLTFGDGGNDYTCAAAPSPAPTKAAFALCSRGLTNIVSTTGAGGQALSSADEVPAIVLAHGNNGLGAYLSSGDMVAGAVDDEAENADQDGMFVSNAVIDDILIWLSRPVLMNRMVTAGKLP